MMLGVDSRGTNPDSRTMAGFVGKRKELEQVVDGLSDFSLSGPAAKSRRLVSQLAHFLACDSTVHGVSWGLLLSI
jgi:hypothetical protein